jgi:hypothetical protein
LQLYFIAAWIFGSGEALDAHKDVGTFVVHPLEIFAFVAALIGWWGTWRNVLSSLALPILGTVQIFLVGDLQDPGNGWVHGLQGGLRSRHCTSTTRTLPILPAAGSGR